METIWILLIGSTLTFSGTSVYKQEWKTFKSAEELAAYVPNINSKSYSIWKAVPCKLTAVTKLEATNNNRCDAVESNDYKRRCILTNGHTGKHFPHEHDPERCNLGWD